MTPLTIQYGEQDLIDSLRAHYRAAGRTRFPALQALIVLALCIGAGQILLTKGAGIEDWAVTSGITLLTVLILYFGIRLLNRSWLIPHHIRKNFALQRELHSPASISWDEESVRVETSRSTSLRPYSDFAFWLEDQGLVMLYTTEVGYFEIPARAFASDAQRDGLIALLRQHGVRPR